MLNKISDLLMFREGTEEEAEGSSQPILTYGSIIWGILLRTAILVIIAFFLADNFNLRNIWYFMIFIIWFVAAYPGWRQFQIYHRRLKIVEEETLCGSCKHFDKSSQLCRIFDEHVTRGYIPCEGLNWEPEHFDTN